MNTTIGATLMIDPVAMNREHQRSLKALRNILSDDQLQKRKRMDNKATAVYGGIGALGLGALLTPGILAAVEHSKLGPEPEMTNLPLPQTRDDFDRHREAVAEAYNKHRDYMSRVDDIMVRLGKRQILTAGALTALAAGGGLWYMLAKRNAEAKKYKKEDLQAFIDNSNEWSLALPHNRAKRDAMEAALIPVYYDDESTMRG